MLDIMRTFRSVLRFLEPLQSTCKHVTVGQFQFNANLGSTALKSIRIWIFGSLVASLALPYLSAKQVSGSQF